MQSLDKASPFGTSSIILAIMNIAIWCVYLTIFVLMINDITLGVDGETAAYLVFFIGVVLIALSMFLLSPIGIILAFIALQKGEVSRRLATAGLVLNVLGFVPCCLFALLIAFGQMIMVIPTL